MKSIAKLSALVLAFATLGTLASPTVAMAQDKPAADANNGSEGLPDDYCNRKGVLCVGVLKIVGRVQRPFALAEVGRISPKLTLSELRQPFLDRIEEAVVHDPF